MLLDIPSHILRVQSNLTDETPNSPQLNRFDPVAETFLRYRHDPTEPASLSSDSVNVLLTTRDGSLWVGTPRGLNRLDRQTGTFTHYGHDAANPRSLADNAIPAK